MTSPIIEFDKILSIYTFSFFGDREHLQYLREQYYLNSSYLCGKTRLFLPASVTNNNSISDIQILQHLTKRIPVYFGKPKLEMFSWEKLHNILNYDYRQLQIESNLVSNIRYAITGPINIMPNSNYGEKRAWLVHLWGVNFESHDTDDYKVLYKKDNQIDIDSYLDRQVDIFNLIKNCIIYAKNQEGSKRVVVHFGMIGMGQYLKILNNSERKICLLLFLEGFISALKNTNNDDNIIWRLCIYNTSEYDKVFLEKLDKLELEYDNIIIGKGEKNGNCLNIDFSDDEQLNCIVNAWDSRSFIGNGGSQDLTLDGYIIANSGGFNTHFRNTGFFHNSFFCPNLLNPRKWVLVDN